MKAYKATKNMRCRSITYEVGKTYTFNGELVMCSQGFHFCENPRNVLDYYGYNKDFVLMEIDVIGKVINEGHKSVTDKFTVKRMVPREEYCELLGITVDANGNLTKEIDRFSGYIYLYEYDENGNKTRSIKNIDGGSYIIEYDWKGNKTKEIGSSGYTYIFEYEYDTHGNMIRSIFPDNKVQIWKYDENENLIMEIDTDGSIFNYEYDAKGNKIREIHPDGIAWIGEYDANGNLTKEVMSNGNIYLYEYDSKGNNTKQINPNGYTWIAEYDEKGNRTKEILPNGDTWSITIE